jgi:hypothetical protein
MMHTHIKPKPKSDRAFIDGLRQRRWCCGLVAGALAALFS